MLAYSKLLVYLEIVGNLRASYISPFDATHEISRGFVTANFLNLFCLFPTNICSFFFGPKYGGIRYRLGEERTAAKLAIVSYK